MSDADQVQISLLLGMLYSLAVYSKDQFNDDQLKLLDKISSEIDRIYYPKPDLSKPTPRGN